jgi:aminoglycoside 2'-N-acetyltransferase I
MVEVRAVHTADLDAAARDALRHLLVEVFRGDLTDDDWDHALGGMHVLAWEGSELVGHAALVQRRLLHRGRALRTGYVEAVGVRPDRRRRGHGDAMMRVVERMVRGAYDLGALSASADGMGFYAARGWTLWTGASFVLAPTGVQRTTDDDGSLFVLPGVVAVDPAGELVCDWRGGDVW